MEPEVWGRIYLSGKKTGNFRRCQMHIRRPADQGWLRSRGGPLLSMTRFAVLGRILHLWRCLVNNWLVVEGENETSVVSQSNQTN